MDRLTHVSRLFRRLPQIRNFSLIPTTDVSDVVGSEVDRLGFERLSRHVIEEYKSDAVLYRHKKTGAEIMCVSNQDINKVFGIAFRTSLNDSSGIAHILEHSVLRGSRKYNMKEPFTVLGIGSFSSYINALTSEDRTCFIVASPIAKDLYYSMDVYLDAVFFPKCIKDLHAFQQEGWHYELNHPSEEISFQGIVLNEMKAFYSDPHKVATEVARQALFPENGYAFNCGGDPRVIPNLSFKAFQDFHRKYYHPSNARIWLYGDNDHIEGLRILSEYLDLFEPSSAHEEAKVKLQPLFSKPIQVFEKYAVGIHLRRGNIIRISWLLSDKQLDFEMQLTLQVLEHLLSISYIGEYLYNLGEDYEIDGFNFSLLQAQFSLAVNNVPHNKFDDVQDMVKLMFEAFIQQDFDHCDVQESIFAVEFSLKGDNYYEGPDPKGVGMMYSSLNKWIYDMDPFEPLMYQKALTSLKARIAQEGPRAVFVPLVEKFLINNPHCVIAIVQPDLDKVLKDAVIERQNLEKVKSNMTEEDLATLVRATQELRLKAEAPHSQADLRRIPSLSLDDLPKTPIHIPSEVEEIAGIKVLWHDLMTHNIMYVEFAFDLSSLRPELLQFLPLFIRSFQRDSEEDGESIQYQARKIDEVDFLPFFTSSVRDKEEPINYLIIQARTMVGREKNIFDEVQWMLQDIELFDTDKLRNYVFQSKWDSETDVDPCRVVNKRIKAKLNFAAWIKEQTSGISYLQFVRSLDKNFDQEWFDISQSLEEIYKCVITRNNCVINVTTNGKNIINTRKLVQEFADCLPFGLSTPKTSWSWNHRLSPGNEAILNPGATLLIYTQAATNSMGAPMSFLITNTWLWDRVRLGGNAYDITCGFDVNSGILCLSSSEDPNLVKTLDIFDETTRFLRDLQLDADNLRKFIVGAIKNTNPYELPAARGYRSLLQHLCGTTEEERQKIHDEILSTSLNDFKGFVDAIEAFKDTGVVVTMANEKAICKANKQRLNFFKVKKVF